MRNRIVGIGIIVIGAVMIIAVLATDLFTVAPAFEDLTDGFRDTVMSDEAIVQAQTDVAGLQAVAVEYETVVVPTLSGALGMETATFTAFVESDFPAVAAGTAALPAVAEEFTGVVNLIASQQANFEAADAIPNDSLPATSVPWAVVGIGVLSIIVGIVTLLNGRTGAILAMVLGLLVVAGSVVFSLVDKSGSADDMNEAFKPAYTEELVVGSQQAIGVVGGMGQEMQTALIPALAQQMEMSPEEVQAFVGENFPATAAALQGLPDTIGRFEVMVSTFDAQLDNYITIRDTALTPIALMVLIGGILIALGGVWVFAGNRKESGADKADALA